MSQLPAADQSHADLDLLPSDPILKDFDFDLFNPKTDPSYSCHVGVEDEWEWLNKSFESSVPRSGQDGLAKSHPGHELPLSDGAVSTAQNQGPSIGGYKDGQYVPENTSLNPAGPTLSQEGLLERHPDTVHTYGCTDLSHCDTETGLPTPTGTDAQPALLTSQGTSPREGDESNARQSSLLTTGRHQAPQSDFLSGGNSHVSSTGHQPNHHQYFVNSNFDNCLQNPSIPTVPQKYWDNGTRKWQYSWWPSTEFMSGPQASLHTDQRPNKRKHLGNHFVPYEQEKQPANHQKSRERNLKLRPEGGSEDNSSVDSWNTDDAAQAWSTQLCGWIRSLSSDAGRTDDNCIFQTPNLSWAERRKANWMAHSHGLFHVSIGSGRSSKSVFVSPFKLQKECRANYVASAQPQIALDTIWVRCKYWRTQEPSCERQLDDVRRGLESPGCPRPIHMERDTLSEASLVAKRSASGRRRQWIFKDHICMRVTYASPYAAAFVRALLHGLRPLSVQTFNEASDSTEFQVQYGVVSSKEFLCYYGDCERSAAGKGYPSRYLQLDHMKSVHEHQHESTLERGSLNGHCAKGLKAVSAECAYTAIQKYLNDTARLEPNGTSSSDSNAVADGDASPLSISRTDSSSPVNQLQSDSHSIQSIDSQMSLGSRASSTSRMSTASPTPSRGRSERIKDGYECASCHKLFDRQSERDKHWKVTHGERQHLCTYCEKGFAYAKDLNRHLEKVHKTK